jgi:hypothetical protein
LTGSISFEKLIGIVVVVDFAANAATAWQYLPMARPRPSRSRALPQTGPLYNVIVRDKQ